MTRYIKVGTGGGEVTWHRAMLDLTPGDYLMLEPGYYDWPRGKVIEDITIRAWAPIRKTLGFGAFSHWAKQRPGLL